MVWLAQRYAMIVLNMYTSVVMLDIIMRLKGSISPTNYPYYGLYQEGSHNMIDPLLIVDLLSRSYYNQ
jgi:hypothetical protein